MLESYIAPLFMGYVDKYIKNLKPSDLSLSLWGGDVVLQNLELNLDVLQEELNLPVKFLSGKIYKLQIHVPWTRLVYDPVVITIDTMEFVIKLKDSSDLTTNTHEDPVSHDDLEKEIESARSHETEQLPPGYVQSILNKVINNVSFKVNNIIIKYIEDDLVLSLNVKSVNFYSTDSDWKKSFVELTLPDLLLHKVCDITDVTICLDQQNSSGRIELYQDPVLYKCNLSCRILSRYKGLSSTKPVENKINVFCENCDFSLTDHQISTMIRLLQLVIGLYYGTLDLPGCKYRKHTAPRIIENHKKEQTRFSTSSIVDENVSADTSWSSWAWSMVPGYGSTDLQKESQSKEVVKNCFGIYVSLTTLTLKKTNQLSDLVSQRLEFSPVMCLELSGCVLEFVSIGDLLIDICVGVQRLVGYTIGTVCICTSVPEIKNEIFDKKSDPIDEVFLQCGKVDNNLLSFLKCSLFSTYSEKESTELLNETMEPPNASSEMANISEGAVNDLLATESENLALNINWLETGKELKRKFNYTPGPKLSPDEITTRYGCIFINYFYEMTLPSLAFGEVENIFLYPDTEDIVPEVSEKHVHLVGCRLFASTKFAHGIKWLHGILTEKIPQRKTKSGVFYDPFVIQQLRLGNFLSRKMTITCINSEMLLYSNDHTDKCDKGSTVQVDKEAVSFHIDRFSLVKTDPMYLTELVSMVEKRKFAQLRQVENLHTNVKIEIEGFQAGINLVNQESLESLSIQILQPTDCSMNAILSIMPDTFEQETSAVNGDYKFKSNSTSFVFTKIHLLLFYEILYSWMSSESVYLIPSYVNNIFQSQGTIRRGFAPVMNIDFKEFFINFIDMKDICGIYTSLSKVCAVMQGVGRDGKIESSLLFQSQQNTESISNVFSWLSGELKSTEDQKAFEVKFQYLKSKNVIDKYVQVIDIILSGSTVNLDPLILAWLSYQVDFQSKIKIKPPPLRHSSSSKINQSTIITPRKSKSYARAYGSNASSHSKEKIDKVAEPEIDNESEKPGERFGEWLAHKINFFKSFHVKIDLQPIILMLPNKRWPHGYQSVSHIQMVKEIYQFKNSEFPATIITCIPKVSISSSNFDDTLLSKSLPIVSSQKRRRVETLPWTVSSKDFASFSLFPNMNQLNTDRNIENLYICKPVSWSLFVGSSSSNKLSRNDSVLSVITENNPMRIDMKSQNKARPSRLGEKQIQSDTKVSLGFVLHMDWSICEIYLSQNVLKLGSRLLTDIYLTTKALNGVSDTHPFVLPSVAKEVDGTVNKDTKTKAARSVSTTSTVDHVEAFSTITGSSNVFAKHKTLPENINVSLWIQCTLPKIKCTFLSKVEKTNTLYQVVSEIEEIMFAFDYQDNIAELTNKIASCIVYYSLFRFDTEPEGWVVIDDGYLLCQKEKSRENAHPDSKTLLSVIYRRTYQCSQTILSPDENVMENPKKESDTAMSMPSTVLQFHNELIIKHAISIHVLSFDLICYSKPILSTIAVFVDLLPDATKTMQTSKPSVKETSCDGTKSSREADSVVTLPLLTFHCDTVRVILPVGDGLKHTENVHDEKESVFLFHIQSIDLNSSPTNPITKSVTDKVLYSRTKLNHRETLKKLKLWNVQYQLDIFNIGLCTTNWKSLETSLSGEFKRIQNPALEWNLKTGYREAMMTPIFPGFNFKATVAPPIILQLKNQFYPVTAAAFELHSPGDVKLFINSCQLVLSMQVINEINMLLLELLELFYGINSNDVLSSVDSSPSENVAMDSEILLNTTETTEKSNSQNFQNILPCIELFASVSCISIMVYHKEFPPSTVYPTFLVNLHQPTCTVSSLKEKKLTFNLLDLSILTSSKTIGLKCDVVPAAGDFNISILHCNKGLINRKTGLLPTFITITTALEHNEIHTNIYVGKPITLSYNVCHDQNIRKFFSNLFANFPTGNETLQGPKATVVATGTPSTPKQQMLAVIFKSFSLSTKRFHFVFAPSLLTDKPSINYQHQHFVSEVNVTYDKTKTKMQNVKVENDLKGSCLFFEEENRKRTNLLQPFIFNFSFLAEFCNHSANLNGERFLPRFYVWCNVGPTQLNINQHACLLIKAMVKDAREILTKETVSCNSADATPVSNNETKPFQMTLDDLRSGVFEYAFQEDFEKVVPNVNQILFSAETTSPPTMTWRYVEPRCISRVTVFPVPFHVSTDAQFQWIEDNETIPCLLEYWDELNHEFFACKQFFLSENEASCIDINDKSLSHLWRIVVAIPEEINRRHEQLIKADTHKSPVPSASLAACIKVDSEFSSQFVPSIQFKLSMDALKLTVGNSLTELGVVSPTKLVPCYLEENDVFPEVYEAVNILFDNVKCESSLINNLSMSLTLASLMSIDVMDYNNFCWRNVMTPTDLAVVVDYSLCGSSDVSKITMKIDETDLNISQTVVHTLTQTARAWGDIGNERAQVLIFSHYILCNQTQDVLHIQQVDTDEDIILRSGQAHPYSWVSFRKQLIRFCIESTGDWKWSDPISINEVGIFPCKLVHTGYSSQLFVEVKNNGGLEKQISFHGSCSFANYLNFDVQMEIITQESIHNKTAFQQTVTNISKKFSLPAHITRPSLTVSTSFIKSIKVAKSDFTIAVKDENAVEVSLLTKDEEELHCIQLKENNTIYQVWLSLSYSSGILGHLMISLSPLYILRSHLAEPVLIRLHNSDESNDCFDMVLHGRGRELQVFTLGKESPYLASFCLAGSKEYSKPPYMLNTTQSDILRQEPKTVCALTEDTWPYRESKTNTTTASNKTGQKVSYTAALHKENPEKKIETRNWQEVDLMFQSSLRWSTLPTILVDLKPWLLITNLTDTAFEIKCNETSYVYTLEKNDTLTPIHIRSIFSLGVHIDGWTVWSNPITVSNEHDVGTPSSEEKLKPGCFCHCSVLNKQKTECYQYSLTCVKNDGMLTVCIKDRFFIHNLSNHGLILLPLMSETMKDTKAFDKLKVLDLPPQSGKSYSLLNINSSEKTLPTGLVMGFKILIKDHASRLRNDTEGSADQEIKVLKDFVLKKVECLFLSEEHLRECISLEYGSQMHHFVLTSSLEDGIVRVFIDLDKSPLVTVTNKTSLNLFLKEIEINGKQQARFEVLCDDKEKLLVVPASARRDYHPSLFKQMFPKCNNEIEWNCQLAADTDRTVELSKPILLQKDTSIRLFVPSLGEVFIKSYVINSHLQVYISEVEQDNEVSIAQSLTLPLIDFQLNLMNLLVVDYQYPDKVTSLMSASLARTRISHYKSPSQSVFKASLGYLQVDNQLQSSCFHFPVIFLPMRQLSDRYHSVTKDAPFPEIEACLDADFCTITLEAGQIDDSKFLENIRVNIQPCEMYLEDTFIYRLAAVVDSYLPPAHISFIVKNQKDTDQIIENVAKSIMHPLRLCNIEVGELSVLLSAHASVKLFLAADHIPLVLGRYKTHPTQTISRELMRSILYHYATQALVRVGWILGSLELIGNPTGLIQNIGRGVSDFFLLPYNGLIRGPTAFVSGVGHGMSSFLKHISTGALTSINNVASSISRNMDRLCLDETHLLLQEERRALVSTRLSTGFRNAFGSLGLSLLGAVAGIVDHPIQNITTANNTSEMLAGVVSGFAKGMVGVVTKPIGGAMEFISQTSQGILQGAGLVKIPERIILMQYENHEDLGREESHMKFLWQYLRLQSGQGIFITSDVIIKQLQNANSTSVGSLILTDTALFVYSSETGNIVLAFPLKEVILLPRDHSEVKFACFQISRQRVADSPDAQLLHRTASLDQNPNFRQFFESFQNLSAANHAEVLCDSLAANTILEVELLASYGDLLMLHYESKKLILEEENYTINSLEL